MTAAKLSINGFSMPLLGAIMAVVAILDFGWRANQYAADIKAEIVKLRVETVQLRVEAVQLRAEINNISDDQWDLRMDAKTGEGEFSRRNRLKREAAEAKKEEAKKP